MQRGKTLFRAVVGALIAGVLLGTAVPASAATPHQPVAAGTAVFSTVLTGASAAAGYQDSCFGYTGTLKDGTKIVGIDWNGDAALDECFGIAPNRTIWHAWKGSGAWRVMPHGGLADKVVTWNLFGDVREIVVYVNGIGNYCSDYSEGAWQVWYRCVGTDSTR